MFTNFEENVIFKMKRKSYDFEIIKMILCKDCIYISDSWRYKEKALCKNKSSIREIDSIDGQKYYLTCYEARDNDSVCGEEACLFVSKRDK